MASRVDLHHLLESFLETKKVYFQPPASIVMSYPCIVYSRQQINNTSADNDVYLQNTTYRVIVIDKNPDSPIVQRIAKDMRFKHENHYVSDNLNHDAFTIKY